MTSGSFFGILLATLCGHSSFLAPFRRRYGVIPACFFSLCTPRAFRVTLPASSQWFGVVFGAIFVHFSITWVKTDISLGGRLAPSVILFLFPLLPFVLLLLLPFLLFACLLERPSAAKRSKAIAWSRPRRRRGPKTTSEALSVPLLWLNTAWDLPVLCHIASTIVLSVFWQLRFLMIWGWLCNPILKVFWFRLIKFYVFFWACFQANCCIDFLMELLTVGRFS